MLMLMKLKAHENNVGNHDCDSKEMSTVI